ncbi:hypothetical protein RZS08_26390, partial [Arthrospira platensis SPKY1]|nr:hypothetical protein [Arthrospira platensis SPKY1]
AQTIQRHQNRRVVPLGARLAQPLPKRLPGDRKPAEPQVDASQPKTGAQFAGHVRQREGHAQRLSKSLFRQGLITDCQRDGAHVQGLRHHRRTVVGHLGPAQAILERLQRPGQIA